MMATQVMAAPPPPMKLEHEGTNGGNLSPLSHAQSMDNLNSAGNDDEVNTDYY